MMPPLMKIEYLQSSTIILQGKITQVELTKDSEGKSTLYLDSIRLIKAPANTDIEKFKVIKLKTYADNELMPGDCMTHNTSLVVGAIIEIYMVSEVRVIDTSIISEFSDFPVSLTGMQAHYSEWEKREREEQKELVEPSGLWVFVLATFILSGIQQFFIIKYSSINNPLQAFLLMWTPGIVGTLCAWFYDADLKKLSLKKPKLKSLLVAYFVPLFVSVLIVFFLVFFKTSEFQINPELVKKKGGLIPTLIAVLLMAPTINMIVAFISGLGEEIGWRGFMASRMESWTPTKRYLTTGIIWSLWHWPLIIFGDYATSSMPWVNVFFFTIMATSLSFLMGYLADKDKSCVAPALLHASHNMWVLGIAPVFFTQTPLIPYLGGESGLYCALIYLVIAVWVHRRIRTQ